MVVRVTGKNRRDWFTVRVCDREFDRKTMCLCTLIHNFHTEATGRRAVGKTKKNTHPRAHPPTHLVTHTSLDTDSVAPCVAATPDAAELGGGDGGGGGARPFAALPRPGRRSARSKARCVVGPHDVPSLASRAASRRAASRARRRPVAPPSEKGKGKGWRASRASARSRAREAAPAGPGLAAAVRTACRVAGLRQYEVKRVAGTASTASAVAWANAAARVSPSRAEAASAGVDSWRGPWLGVGGGEAEGAVWRVMVGVWVWRKESGEKNASAPTHTQKKTMIPASVSSTTVAWGTCAGALAAAMIFEVRRRAVPPPHTTEKKWKETAALESWAKPRAAAPGTPVVLNPFRKNADPHAPAAKVTGMAPT